MDPLILLLFLMMVLALPLFLSARRQKRTLREAQELQSSLEVGDLVMTTSGLRGTVAALGEDTLDLEIAPGVHTTWVRAAIRERVVDPDPDDVVQDGDEVPTDEMPRDREMPGDAEPRDARGRA
ncbi:MAG: preprotein translocase subunit YajC [Actinomycetota bacterium]|nr:preprotein translocase subunit YajC [Actinomycetota bacterium]